MKKLLLGAMALAYSLTSFGQNINDHDIVFQYIQLPLIKIDDKYDSYSVHVNHNYLEANKDSAELYLIKNKAAMDVFHQMMSVYQLQVDSLNRSHLIQMADWEKKTNAGVTNADGTALAMPASPLYPTPPSYPLEQKPILNSMLDTGFVENLINVDGYSKGGNDVKITVSIGGITFMPIKENKTTTSGKTKYTYSLPYTLPIQIKVETTTQGVLLEQEYGTGIQNYGLKSFDSKYEYQVYMLDNRDAVYADAERSARNSVFNSINQLLNNQIGFPEVNRRTELYSVKKFKDFDYSDVTNAFTLTSQALYKVKLDRDHSTAMDEIDDAIKAIDAILAESNTYDKKSRINDKITAMLQCNKIELLIWQAEFDEAFTLMNLVLNSGEGKARRHVDGLQGYYRDLQKRWEANY